MLDERQMHPYEGVAQLRALRGAVGELAQLVEHRPRTAAVLGIVRCAGVLFVVGLWRGGRRIMPVRLLPLLLAVVHVVRPLCLLRRVQPAAVVVRAHRMRPGLLPGDGHRRHPRAAFEIFHGAPCSVMTVRDRRRAPCTG